MNKMDLSELDVEFIRDIPLWGSFLNALQEFYEESVRGPLRQLQEIRDIKATTDLNFVKHTLADAGINIPADMIVEPERLYNSVYMIPLIHQLLGLESAYRVIAFILGRRVRVSTLYTEDYVTFYETPYGPLRIDGGTWYKTTHINLEMQKVGTDSKLNLPNGQTLKDRFLSAFFEMAPVNVVVDQFYFLIEVENKEDFGLQGVVYRQPVRRLVVDPEYSLETKTFRIEGADTVESGDTSVYRLMAGSEVFYVNNWTSSHPQNVEILSDGTVTFSGFDTISLVTLTVEINNQIVNKNVQVGMPLQDVRMLVIDGPSTLKSEESADYRVIAYHRDGTTVLENAVIQVSSGYASFAGNTLTAKVVPIDQQIGLQAIVKIGGINYNAAKLVTLKYVDPNVFLTGLKISGENRLKDGSVYQFNATAFLSDGSTHDALCLWKTSSPSVVIDTGIVSTALVEGDTEVLVSATYGYRAITITAEMYVTVYPEFITCTGIEIKGPDNIYSETKNTYTCIGSFSDGSSTIITPTWFTTQFKISENGVLDAGIVSGVETLEIRATYAGITEVLPVTIQRDPVLLQSLIVSGQNSIREGTVVPYYAFAQYSNGNTVEIKPEWSLEDDYDWATFIDGELLVESPKESTVSVKATYKVGSTEHSQTKTVVCVSASNSITGLFITGPNVVDALDRIILTATASYEDGSFVQVNPVWEVFTEDTNADFIAADIAGLGIVTGRNVDENMQVIVRATYFREVVEYPITVRYVEPKGPDVPVTSRIIGPAIIYSTQVGSYSQAILFEKCKNELLVSSDWTSDNDDVIIDENGFVTCKVNKDMVATITATWSCGGYSRVDSMIITVIPLDVAYTGLGIIGPDTMQIGVKESYTAEVYTAETGSTLGKGKIVTATWTVLTDGLNIQNFYDGGLRISGAVVNQLVTLSANFSFDGTSVEGTKTIRVLGSGPIYAQGTLDTPMETLFERGIMVSANEFSDDFKEYGFFMVPSVFGNAGIFNADNSPDDWFGNTETSVPQIYKRTVNGVEMSWHIYRTKQRALGQKKFRVVYT